MRKNNETGSLKQPYSEPRMKVVLMQSKSIIAGSLTQITQTEGGEDIIQ